MRLIPIISQSISELDRKVDAIAGPVGANLIDHKMDACDIIDKFDEMLKLFGLEVIMFEGVGEEPIITIAPKVAFEVAYHIQHSTAKDLDGHFPDQEQAETFFNEKLAELRVNYTEPEYFIDDHRIDPSYGSPMIRTVSVVRWVNKPGPVPEDKNPRKLQQPIIHLTLSTYEHPKYPCWDKACAGCDRMRPEGGMR